MANIKCCDRCGKPYKEKNNFFINKEITVFRDCLLVGKEYDLCPGCQADLEKWMEGEKENE